jgi:hypothetical protein
MSTERWRTNRVSHRVGNIDESLGLAAKSGKATALRVNLTQMSPLPGEAR